MAKKPVAAVAAAASINLALLSSIVSATSAGGFLYVLEADAQPLVDAKLAEVNPEMRNETGAIATRSTPDAVAYLSANAPAEATAGTAAEGTDEDEDEGGSDTGGYEIDDGIPVPAIKRGGAGGTTYPFDALKVGQSFHVPATKDKPNPAKSLASTVSSATARYAEEVKDDNGNVVMVTVKVKETVKDGEGKDVVGADGKPVTREAEKTVAKTRNTRVFSVRTVGKDDPKGEGARVWRTA